MATQNSTPSPDQLRARALGYVLFHDSDGEAYLADPWTGKMKGVCMAANDLFDGDDEITARRWEIAENLHRADLSKLERDEQIAEWERLGLEAQEVLRTESAKPASSPKGGRPKSGTREVARELGVDEKEVRNARKVSSLTDEAKAVAKELDLDDNRSALLRAAAQKPDKQADELRRIQIENEQRKIAAARKRGETESLPEKNQDISAEELAKIRRLDDFDLIMLISEVHDHGEILLGELERDRVVPSAPKAEIGAKEIGTALGEIRDAMRLLSVCSTAIEEISAYPSHDIALTLGTEVWTALHNARVALGETDEGAAS